MNDNSVRDYNDTNVITIVIIIAVLFAFVVLTIAFVYLRLRHIQVLHQKRIAQYEETPKDLFGGKQLKVHPEQAKTPSNPSSPVNAGPVQLGSLPVFSSSTSTKKGKPPKAAKLDLDFYQTKTVRLSEVDNLVTEGAQRTPSTDQGGDTA